MRDLAKPQLWEKDLRDAEAQQVRNSMAAMLRNFDEDEEAFVDECSDDSGFQTPTDNISDTSTYHNAMMEPTESIGEHGERQSHFDAYELRMNLALMQAISRSQDRCLDLWTENTEPALRNSDFKALLVRCKSEGIDWTPSQLQLYEDLAEWRERVARENECAANFVCSLGFLAMIAFKRPTNGFSLRRISFDLPEMLQVMESYRDELFALVRKSRMDDDLDEYEDLTSFPSFRNQPLTKPSWSAVFGLVSCAAFVVLATMHKSRRLRR